MARKSVVAKPLPAAKVLVRRPRTAHRKPGAEASVLESLIIDEVLESPVEAESDGIARLAYALWEERGCPEGTPEEDWLRAEELLRA